MKKVLVFCTVAALLFLSSFAHATIIASTFDSSDENWTISGLASKSFQSTGGNPGGYLYTADTGGDTYEAVAPSKFWGNLSSFIGGTISFDAKILSPLPPESITYGSGFGKVTFVGYDPAQNRYFDAELDFAPNPPSSDWTTYSGTLDASLWGVTQERWEYIFANVTQIRVILESVVGLETMGFDNFKVQSVPEPATMLLLGCGLIGLAGLRRKFNQSRNTKAVALQI